MVLEFLILCFLPSGLAFNVCYWNKNGMENEAVLKYCDNGCCGERTESDPCCPLITSGAGAGILIGMVAFMSICIVLAVGIRRLVKNSQNHNQYAPSSYNNPNYRQVRPGSNQNYCQGPPQNTQNYRQVPPDNTQNNRQVPQESSQSYRQVPPENTQNYRQGPAESNQSQPSQNGSQQNY